MKSSVKNLFKKKKFLKFLAIGVGFSLTTTTIALPTIYYATAQNLLYVDSLGNVVKKEGAAKVKNEYKGDFTPGTAYKAGDVVSVKEKRFFNEELLPEFEATYNQVMYTFTQDWSGNDFSQAPVKKYDPKNLTTISIPLSQFITDDTMIESFMGHSNRISGIGKASITGKFDGSGAAYDPWNKPGYATVNNSDLSVKLSGLSDFFTWTKNNGSILPNERDPMGYPVTATPSPTQNAYPTINEPLSEQRRDRYAFDRAGMYAIQLSNVQESNSLNVVDDWYSSIDASAYVSYADMQVNQVRDFYPTFCRLSTKNESDKFFYLDDDNLGVYIYSKSSNYPFAARYATSTAITNASMTGFYQGVGEPLYSLSEGQYRYLTRDINSPSENITVKYPTSDGTPGQRNFNVGFQSSYGAYVYSKSTIWPGPDTYLQIATEFDIKPFNPDRDVSYVNGVFSINKPSQFLNKGEQQEIKWYVPIASTDFSVQINQQKIDELASKFLATDAMNLAYINEFYKPYLYNAIPSTFYGANLTVTADNTTGTIWINMKSGPTVEVTNGALLDQQQQPGAFAHRPNWLLGMNWVYYNSSDDATSSRYWYRNTDNPISEVLMDDPIDYTVAITGFQKVQPTKIVTTTNLKGDEFIPGSSLADETEYGPYRLTGSFINKTPFDYNKEEEAKPETERYSELMTKIFEDLVYNKGPSFVNPNTSKPFIQQENLLKVSDVMAYNFVDQNHPDWGGRIQFSVTLNAYFSEEGLFIENGGFPSVPVMFSGFKAVPGPTSINANYNLNSMIPGGALEFNRQNLGTQNGINYPSDYLDPASISGDSTVYKRLEDLIYKWSNRDPFIGAGSSDYNQAFTAENFMVKNLPEQAADGAKAFTIGENDVEFNNFAGTLKITPKFNRYYNLNGDLVTGVNTSLGTITISGFQTVDGSTYIPSVVQAISTESQPSAIVTGSNNVDSSGNYIGQELYKIAWNEAINLPTKNYELPPYGNSSLTPTQIEEIKRVVDIKIKPDDKQWVDNKNGFLKFAVAFKRIFDVNGIPKQIPARDLWPTDWENDKPNDHIFIVTVYGYNSSPGPTGVLQQVGETGQPENRNIFINQPNFQPSEFIKNDGTAGFPLLRSLIQGNLINLPNNFNSQDIVLSVEDYNADNSVTWDPVGEGKPLPLVPNNAEGSISVQVYLKTWYNSDSKLCTSAEDNQNMPYTSTGEANQGPAWSFTINGFMKTTAKGASDLCINDSDFAQFSSPNAIDLSNSQVLSLLNSKYPQIAKLKNMLPYQFATPTALRELLLIKNNSQSSKIQPYFLMKNIPENIKPYNIFIKKENIVVNNIAGSVSFKLTLKQWYSVDKATSEVVYHPTLEDQSNGVVEFTTTNSITITGLKKVNNATIIKPTGDTVDNQGVITITKGSTSENIINGILLEKYINEKPENINNLQNYVPFVASENQSIVLDDVDLKVYIYVALFESGGSPYTLEKGSIVERTDVGSYHVNDLDALNEFITWKITPFYDLQSGSVEMYPMLNTWFGGPDAQIFNQYQSFGAGDLGKPQVANGNVQPATITTVKLSGFIQANSALSFNDAYVFNGQALVQRLDTTQNPSIALSKFTANDFVKNPLFMDSINNMSVETGAIISIVNEPGNSDFSIRNIIDFNDPKWYKVNELNGTIEIKTKELKYFDGNKELQVGRISLILSGFKPSVSAYQTTYIVLIITIVALIVVLAIVLSRILWVKYNKSRKGYEN